MSATAGLPVTRSLSGTGSLSGAASGCQRSLSSGDPGPASGALSSCLRLRVLPVNWLGTSGTQASSSTGKLTVPCSGDAVSVPLALALAAECHWHWHGHGSASTAASDVVLVVNARFCFKLVYCM